MKPQRFIAERGGERLDRYLAGKLEGVSRAHVQSLIRRGQVFVDGRESSPNIRLRGGETIQVQGGASSWTGADFDSWVLREDEELLVLRKPAGVLTHPMGESWISRPEAAASDAASNVAGMLVHHRPEIVAAGVPRSGIVHRLDRQTSGALVVAKTPGAYEHMLEAFKERRVEKVYRAVVLGELKKTEVEAPIGRKPGRRRIEVTPYGKEASTAFEPVESAKGLSLVAAKPLTGRTHQIRAHAALLGHPVLADPEAFREAEKERLAELGHAAPPRMMLHAYRIRFLHPGSGKKASFTAALPKDIRDYWAAVRGPRRR